MKKFKILVWYRYVSAGEIEKDFEIHEISAISPQDAIMNVNTMYYSGTRKIPFKYEVNHLK